MDEESTKHPLESNCPDRGEDFVRLLLEHEAQVRGFLRSLLPTWNDVDEVLQEASLVAWRKFADFEQGTAFGGWFLTIARFEALKHRRRVARTPQVFAEDVWNMLADEATEEPVESSYGSHLDECLSKLKPDQRRLMLEVYSPGVVIRELALQSSKSEEAFYKSVQRMRALLLDCVSKSIARESF